MEKLQWFKFSYADWRMGKIQKCPEITQARFMNLCCLYWNKEAELTLEDAEIEIDKEHLEILISKKVIEEDGKYIFIKFLDEQLEDISETSKGKSKAAKVRWDKYREEKAAKNLPSISNAEPMHMHTDALQKSAEESREEKKRKDIINNNTPDAKASESEISNTPIKKPFKEKEKSSAKKESFDWANLLAFINKTTGRKFKVINHGVRLKYNSRMKDGYTKDDISNAIINATKSDFHKENGGQYLTPEYFSRAETIDKFSEKSNDSDKTTAPKMNT